MRTFPAGNWQALYWSFLASGLLLAASLAAAQEATQGEPAQAEPPAERKPADPEPKPAESQPAPNQPEPAKQPAPLPLRNSTDLPWVKKKSSSDPIPILRPPTGVREILEKYDIADSQLSGFFHGEPLTPGQEDVLVRILFRLPRIGYESLQKWRKPELALDQLVADTAQHRLEVVPLKGRLTAVEQREVSPELAARLEMKHYYLARINLDQGGYVAVVAVRRIPPYWLEAAELNEPVSLDGIYLKVVEQDPPLLLFTARRIHWLPDRPIPEMNIGPDQLRLAALGLDLTLLEDLKQSNRREMGDLDREPQYQMLDLAGRIPSAKLVPDPPKQIDIVALLQEPEKHQGELVTVYGFARRITKVMVEDPDIRVRFGITHYFEVDIGVDLGDKSIHFVDEPKKKKAPANGKSDPAKTDAEKSGDGKSIDASDQPEPKKPAPKKSGEAGPVFNNDYPVTVCVRELSPGLQPSDAMRELVQIDGIFMKTWAYRNAKMSQYENKLQVAPLIIGKVARRVVPTKVHNWVSDVLVGFALAVAAMIVGSVILWFRSSERAGNVQQAVDDKVHPSFAGLENAPTKPDFSDLAKVAKEENT